MLDPIPLAVADPVHSPRDWPKMHKWTATLILSGFAFVQPLAETMLAPVKKQITTDLHITYAYEWFLVNSLILIGIGIAPLLMAPLSEVYGRRPVLIFGSTIFVVWNTTCGAARTTGQLLTFRLLSGFGASVADALAGGLVSDLWAAEERGRAFAVYMAAPLLGPAIGPICGAFIADDIDWPWVFWIISIATAVVIFLAVIFLRETYEPRIRYLHWRRERRSGGEPAETSVTARPYIIILTTNLQRPLIMLGTQVIVQLLATYMAVLYGTMFLFLYIYPIIWTEQYGQSAKTSSLNYISFAIGLIAGVNFAGRLSDALYTRLRNRTNNGCPEFRIPPMAIGTVFVPIGLLVWGWSGEAKVHWVVPNIGSLIFAMGVYICSSSVSVYMVDTYTQYSASAISTNLMVRSITAAVFPLFGPYMFDALHFGKGATVLAGGFTVFGSMVVYILWFYGDRLRAKSPYCITETDR